MRKFPWQIIVFLAPLHLRKIAFWHKGCHICTGLWFKIDIKLENMTRKGSFSLELSWFRVFLTKFPQIYALYCRFLLQQMFTRCLGKSSKKRGTFYGQAHRKNPPLTVSFLWIFFGVFFILDYDSMCSEMDFTPEKSFSSNYKNSQLLLTAAAALSQNGQIAV